MMPAGARTDWCGHRAGPAALDEHARIMFELRERVKRAVPRWYSRDLFWEELQRLRVCEHEGGYTDAEWMGALEALDDRLRVNSALRAKMALSPGQGPRSLEDRRDVAALARREYLGVVRRYKWYHRDVFCRFLRETGGMVLSLGS